MQTAFLGRAEPGGKKPAGEPRRAGLQILSHITNFSLASGPRPLIVSCMAKHDPTLNALFQALSDPTRRGMIQRLMAGPASVSELAAPLDMALPTVLQHLAKLERGGLVTTEKQGRTRICRANPNAMDTASDWLSRQRAIWEARLDRLDDYVQTLMQDTPDDT